MSQDISISTIGELEAFLDREHLALTYSRLVFPTTARRVATLEKLNDRGNVVGVYDGTGASMLEAIVDAIRCMHERRRVLE